MKKLLKSALILGLSLLFFACSTDSKIELFNGKDLDNWNIIVDSEDGEPKDLFYVEDGIMNTPGDPFGYIRTRESFSSYKLHLEWRWVEEPANSGVLLNVQGPELRDNLVRDNRAYLLENLASLLNEQLILRPDARLIPPVQEAEVVPDIV